MRSLLRTIAIEDLHIIHSLSSPPYRIRFSIQAVLMLSVLCKTELLEVARGHSRKTGHKGRCAASVTTVSALEQAAGLHSPFPMLL